MNLRWIQRSCAVAVVAGAFVSMTGPLASGMALPHASSSSMGISSNGIDLRQFGIVVTAAGRQPPRDSSVTVAIKRQFLAHNTMTVAPISLTSPRLTATYGHIVTNYFAEAHAAAPFQGWLVAAQGTKLAFMSVPVGYHGPSAAAFRCTTYGVFNSATSQWQSWLQSCNS